MAKSVRLRLLLLLTVLVPLHLAAATVCATEISAAASGRVCGLKERLVVEVSVKNPSQASAPVPEPSDDFDIELATGVSNPSYRRSTSIFGNQQTNTEEYLYRFTARPRREGDLTIPSFVLTEQGVQHRTEPIRIHVTAEAVPPPRADVFARVVVSRPTAYLGEGVELFLEIYARDYEQDGQRPL
ncbi:MAG TPA: BatD family protein, partial [Phycisphaerae bacterium]|nr:BatD family protein [Phycisphaerae bacterium]